MNHQTSESLECTWDSDCWAYFDQNTLSGVDVNLQFSGLVDWRVEEGKQTLKIVSTVVVSHGKVANLMCDIWSGIADIAIHLAHDPNVLVTVQQRVFLLTLATWSTATVAGLVCLETGIREDDDQSLCVLIGGGDGNMLFGDELWEGWWREGLSS